MCKASGIDFILGLASDKHLPYIAPHQQEAAGMTQIVFDTVTFLVVSVLSTLALSSIGE
jgi:hypothetical protein